MKSGNQEAVKTDRAVSRQRTFAMEHYLPVTMERQVGERLMRHIKPRGIKRLWAVTEAVREWLDRQGAEK